MYSRILHLTIHYHFIIHFIAVQSCLATAHTQVVHCLVKLSLFVIQREAACFIETYTENTV